MTDSEGKEREGGEWMGDGGEGKVGERWVGRMKGE